MNLRLSDAVWGVLLPVAITVLPGCSTIITVVGGATGSYQCDARARVPRVYSGVANEFRQMRYSPEDWPVELHDLPGSFAADTVLLPVTLITQYLYGDLCPCEAGRYEKPKPR